MREDTNSFNGDEDTDAFDPNDVEQVIELGSDDEYEPDSDEDQQSTSNPSEMEVEDVSDDSVESLQAHDQDCYSIAVSGNKWFASGGEDDTAFLWNHEVSVDEPVLKIEHKDSVTIVRFNSKNTLLATCDMSGRINITELSSLKQICSIEDCNDLEWMVWHSTNDIVFVGDKDGTIWMFLIGADGVAQSKIFAGNGSPSTVGVLLPNGLHLLAGYADGTVRLWNLKDQSSNSLFFHSPITAIEHHPSLNVAIVGTQSGTVNIIGTNAETGHVRKISLISPLQDLAPDEDDVGQCVECISMSTAQPWFSVGRNDGSFCVYELDSVSPRSIFRAPQAKAMSCSKWITGSPYVCVGSFDSMLRVFDSRTGAVAKELGNGGDGILDLLVVHPDASTTKVVTAGCNGMVRTFNVFE